MVLAALVAAIHQTNWLSKHLVNWPDERTRREPWVWSDSISLGREHYQLGKLLKSVSTFERNHEHCGSDDDDDDDDDVHDDDGDDDGIWIMEFGLLNV